MPDIFGGEPPATPAVRAEDLVGEGKKFKDIDALAAGKLESDRFIEQLKAEKADAEARASRAVEVEAELQKLREDLIARKAPEPVGKPAQPSQPATTDIEKIVLDTITRTEKLKTETQNIREANALMVAKFGDPDKASAEVSKRANDLGLSMDDIKGIAARSPSAFKRIMLGDADVETMPALNRSTISPVADLKVIGNKAGTKEYYQELLAKNPKKYNDPSTQREIIKAMEAGTYIP